MSKLRGSTSKKLEGEGSYTAARRYDSDVRAFTRKADVRSLAEAARRAVDGPEGPALRQAEARAKARGKTPAPARKPPRRTQGR